MSTTRSPSRRGRAIEDAALLILAHGSEAEARARASAQAHAAAIRERALFAEVAVGFHRGTPSFREALEGLGASRVYLVPFFLSDGYYTRVSIPKALSLAGSVTVRDGRTLVYCPPVGLNPALAGLAARRVAAACAEHGFAPAETTVIVAAHGTEKNPASGEVARGIAQAIGGPGGYARALAAFLEEPPLIAEALVAPRPGPAVVLGLFAAEGMHGEEDMRGLIDEARRSAPGSPLVYTGALGAEPEIADLIVAQAAASGRPRASRR